MARSHLTRLFPVLLLAVVELGIALPVLPAIALALGGNAVDVGLLYAVQSLGQFIAVPLWGSFSDRVGRRRVIALTLLLAAVCELTTAAAPTLLVLYISRFAVGLTSAAIATGSALIADVTDEANRSKGMAVIGVSFGIGFTLGPAIGALTAMLPFTIAGLAPKGLAFLFSAASAALGAILAFALITEPESHVSPQERRRPSLAELRDLLRRPTTHLMYVLFFFYTIAASILESTFFLYSHATWGYDEREVGGILAAMGLLMAACQGGVGRASKRLGDRRMTLAGGVMVVLGLGAAPIRPELGFFLIAVAVATIGRALVHPGILSLSSQTADGPQDRGRVMGGLQSSASLGRIAGPAVGGWIFATLSPRAPFFAAAALLFLSFVWWLARLRQWDSGQLKPAGSTAESAST